MGGCVLRQVVEVILRVLEFWVKNFYICKDLNMESLLDCILSLWEKNFARVCRFFVCAAAAAAARLIPSISSRHPLFALCR